MSKLMSLTIVKNEEKIIESFIRYNSYYFDLMMIVDNGCTDATMDIIYKLKEEGYPLVIRNASYVDFELLSLGNKYLFELIDDYNADWVVHLDADEFFYVSDKQIFEKLSKEKTYYIYWDYYVLLETDSQAELCIPRRMKHRLRIKPEKEKEEKRVTKVVVSAELFRQEKGAYVTAGHHGYGGLEPSKIEHLSEAYIGHFPIVSKEQMKLKIKVGYVNRIPWMTRAQLSNQINFHKIKMDQGTFDEVVFMRGGYLPVYQKVSDYDIIEDPFNPVIVNEIKIKYTSDTPIDVEESYHKQAEIMALKLFNEKKRIGESAAPKVLVYGTGRSAENLFDEFEEGCVEVLAYVDSDEQKQYYKFHHNIIILPDKIKFYNYDKIIIASVYYEEIKEILLKYHIPEEKIVDKSYLIRLSLGKICHTCS